MTPGKIAAQCSHASLGSYKKTNKKIRKKWEANGAKKVVLKVKNKKELLELRSLCQNSKIPSYLVKDAGRTQLPKGTITCLGIGPEKEEKIDKITGSLPLLK